jgi:hypothetical protein
MKVGNTLFWLASAIAAIIILRVTWDFLYGMSQGFLVLNVHALMIAAVIWVTGFAEAYFSWIVHVAMAIPP